MTEPAPLAVFAYGTLLFPEVFEIVVGRRGRAQPATLAGHRRAALVDRVYPGLVEAPGHVTEGVLYTDLDTVALAALDRFEDVLYDRKRVEVTAADAGRALAFVYVLGSSYRTLVTAEGWDPAAFAVQLPAYLDACRGHPEGPAPTG